MPSFKSLSNKMLGGIKKRGTGGSDLDGESRRSGDSDSAVDLQSDTPEAVAARAVKAFCESGGPGQQNGNEVTFLPAIVESAESSPTAAAECARLLRKFLKKDYWSKPSYQYNALMLVRILSDNPGQTFTRNLDGKFVDALKELLRNGRDLSVRQMLMETLDQFEHQKSWDEGLAGVIEMWKKEKEKAYKAYGGRGPPPPPPPNMMGGSGFGVPVDNHSQNYFARAHNSKRLPEPVELANRLEEAKTSAGLLLQLVANTPSTEVLDNDLIKEFADRCLSASRSIQSYMTAENPGPDNETMESLIDVNEQLQQALNSQKRAMLSARKELGLDSRSQNPSPQPQPETNGSYPPPIPVASGAFAGAPAIPRREVGKGKARQSQGPPEPVGYVAPPAGPPPGPPRGRDIVSPLDADDADEEDRNPFLDPQPAGGLSEKARGKSPAPRVPVSPVEQSSSDRERFPSSFSQPTKSYLGRQDSAMDHIQMHGAGGGDVSEHHSGAGNHSAYKATGSSAAGASSAVPRKNRYEYGNNEVTEDIYKNDGTRESTAAGSNSAYDPYRY
ncbi:hypothetical protein N0V82_006302 [Gnomoniopsis sp. IMI 355080]|nr:hypothetical protein N0V82_006302 [Gnomoniopsis sp. IMI 355080]